MKKQKGFTLIELLVVIAIIALLASIVLVALGGARTKGDDATAEQNLSNAISQAEIYNSENGSYSGVCTSSTGIAAMLLSAAKAEGYTTYTHGMSTGECNDNANAWAASISLKSGTGQYFCVDSAGASNIVGWGPVWGNQATCNLQNASGT